LSASRADLLALAQLINAYREDEVDDLDTVLEDLEKPLQRAIKALTSEDDLLLMCECLHQAPHYGLLEYAATRALEVRPDRPLFVYYQIYGRAEGDLDQVKDRDYDRLQHAMERARATKDHRAATSITRFLSQGPFSLPFGPKGGGSMPMPPSMPLPVPPKMRREMEQIRKELERLPPALRDRMLDQILDDLPPDDDFPPEIQRALMKMMLFGGNIEDLLDELPEDLPLPFPGGRGGRGKRRR
ncbi:MAG: hypothetical protein H6R23_1404, partial [Proteobacteria bacterium]|nr:hypothetical protein [Pseudomonadota bacterium]